MSVSYCHTPTGAIYITNVHKLVNHYKLLSHTNCMQTKVTTVINMNKTFDLIPQTLTSCQFMPGQSQPFLSDQLLLGHIPLRPCSIFQVFSKFLLIGQKFPVYLNIRYDITRHNSEMHPLSVACMLKVASVALPPHFYHIPNYTSKASTTHPSASPPSLSLPIQMVTC